MAESLAADPGSAGAADRLAVLYRKAVGTQICPHGLKARWRLQQAGYEVDDRVLSSPEAVESFKAEAGVGSTPQIYLGGQRIGGHDALRAYLLGLSDATETRTYRPVLVIFAVAALLASLLSAQLGTHFTVRTVELFAALSMTMLAVQKLRDVESFSTSFLSYDLLARRWVGYAYVYPYGEALAGLLMVAGGVAGALAAPLALTLGGIGVASVFKAVYVEGRDLNCACAGGQSAVPLGALSLTENIVMVVMGCWMLLKLAL